MIRKLLSILVLLVYLPAVAGVGFSTHYCDGEASKTKVFSVSKQSCCCGEAEEETSGCCKDEIRVVKLDRDQMGNDHRLSVKPLVSEAIFSYSQPLFQALVVAGAEKNIDPSPPLVLAQKRTVLHCCYRI